MKAPNRMPRHGLAGSTIASRRRHPYVQPAWKLEDAKARFSELVRRARDEGPQRVTACGKDAFVVIAVETPEKLLPSKKPRQNLVDFLQGLDIGDLDLTRDRDTGRDIALCTAGCCIPKLSRSLPSRVAEPTASRASFAKAQHSKMCYQLSRRHTVSIIQAHIHVAPDGTIIGYAPGAAPGEHDAAIILPQPARSPAAQAEAIATIRAIQEAVAQLPVLDDRPPDEIVGYDVNGRFR